MPTATIPWQTGGGNITVTYTGIGNATPSVSSSPNDGIDRQQVVTWKTTAGGTQVARQQTIRQAGQREALNDSAGSALMDSQGSPLWALKQ